MSGIGRAGRPIAQGLQQISRTQNRGGIASRLVSSARVSDSQPESQGIRGQTAEKPNFARTQGAQTRVTNGISSYQSRAMHTSGASSSDGSFRNTANFEAKQSIIGRVNDSKSAKTELKKMRQLPDNADKAAFAKELATEAKKQKEAVLQEMYETKLASLQAKGSQDKDLLASFEQKLEKLNTSYKALTQFARTVEKQSYIAQEKALALSQAKDSAKGIVEKIFDKASAKTELENFRAMPDSKQKDLLAKALVKESRRDALRTLRDLSRTLLAAKKAKKEGDSVAEKQLRAKFHELKATGRELTRFAVDVQKAAKTDSSESARSVRSASLSLESVTSDDSNFSDTTSLFSGISDTANAANLDPTTLENYEAFAKSMVSKISTYEDGSAQMTEVNNLQRNLTENGPIRGVIVKEARNEAAKERKMAQQYEKLLSMEMNPVFAQKYQDSLASAKLRARVLEEFADAIS